MNKAPKVPQDGPLSPAERTRFDTLYREQREAILRVLRTRVDCESEVADLMQETFLRVLRYRHCEPESLKFLLLRIALNLAVSHGRLSRVRCDHSLGDWDFAADEPAVDDLLAQQEEVQRLLAAVGALPERCRQAFVLSRFHGIRQHEIATRYGISRRMVELHIARAQAFIRERCA